MSKRRIARRHIAAAHLASTARGSRLLAASNGDFEHAERIDRVLGDLAEHSTTLAPVVQLPGTIPGGARPFACTVDEAGGARPYDLERDAPAALARAEALLEPARRPSGLLLAAGLGVALWVLLAAIAFGIFEALEAIA